MTKDIPAGRWPLRPFDPKCKTYIDPDPVVEDQIRQRVEQWTGDFWEVEPELTAQGVRFDELPSLTPKRIGQYVIRAAQGGSLRVGPIGTASHAIVQMDLPTPPRSEDDAWAEANLEPYDWRILEVCVKEGFTDRRTAKSLKTIAAYVAGQNGKPVTHCAPDLRRHADRLKARGYVWRGRGGGTSITAKGIALLKARRTDQGSLLRLVTR